MLRLHASKIARETLSSGAQPLDDRWRRLSHPARRRSEVFLMNYPTSAGVSPDIAKAWKSLRTDAPAFDHRRSPTHHAMGAVFVSKAEYREKGLSTADWDEYDASRLD